LKSVIDLGFHPIADTFLEESHLHEEQKTYPLRVMLCEDCGYAGLEFVVPSEVRYQLVDYSYTSANSPVSIKHFNEVAAEVADFAALGSEDLVVDVGSNDGTLLAGFKSASGCKILGVEPAPNIAKLAVSLGIPTIAKFFDSSVVEEVVSGGKPKVIITANVLNHASDLHTFVGTAKQMLAEDGFFVFEVPYLLDLVEKTAFDTIYLEHVSYYGIKPLKKLFEQFGFVIRRIEHTDYMGGSIRVYVGTGEESVSVAEYVERENAVSLYDLKTYKDFMARVQGLRLDLCKQLYDARSAGKKIVGIGAATKGNTLLNYCKIDASLLDYVTDVSDLKVGKYTPGSHILIKHDNELDASVDYALILPWNIAEFLVKKLSHLKCEFIIPHTEKI
jgi:hypothetical protein